MGRHQFVWCLRPYYYQEQQQQGHMTQPNKTVPPVDCQQQCLARPRSVLTDNLPVACTQSSSLLGAAGKPNVAWYHMSCVVSLQGNAAASARPPQCQCDALAVQYAIRQLAAVQQLSHNSHSCPVLNGQQFLHVFHGGTNLSAKVQQSACNKGEAFHS